MKIRIFGLSLFWLQCYGNFVAETATVEAVLHEINEVLKDIKSERMKQCDSLFWYYSKFESKAKFTDPKAIIAIPNFSGKTLYE